MFLLGNKIMNPFKDGLYFGLGFWSSVALLMGLILVFLTLYALMREFYGWWKKKRKKGLGKW